MEGKRAGLYVEMEQSAKNLQEMRTRYEELQKHLKTLVQQTKWTLKFKLKNNIATIESTDVGLIKCILYNGNVKLVDVDDIGDARNARRPIPLIIVKLSKYIPYEICGKIVSAFINQKIATSVFMAHDQMTGEQFDHDVKLLRRGGSGKRRNTDGVQAQLDVLNDVLARAIKEYKDGHKKSGVYEQIKNRNHQFTGENDKPYYKCYVYRKQVIIAATILQLSDSSISMKYCRPTSIGFHNLVKALAISNKKREYIEDDQLFYLKVVQLIPLSESPHETPRIRPTSDRVAESTNRLSSSVTVESPTPLQEPSSRLVSKRSQSIVSSEYGEDDEYGEGVEDALPIGDDEFTDPDDDGKDFCIISNGELYSVNFTDFPIPKFTPARPPRDDVFEIKFKNPVITSDIKLLDLLFGSP
jgi:hypothetical protein